MSDETQPPPIHLVLRDARRSRGITQAELARRAGCVQSAVSMMEQGRPDAVSRETLEKIASELGVTLPEAANGPVPATSAEPVIKICPNPDCPSNYPYRVGAEVFLMPRPHRTPGTRCPHCGEVLTSVCPSCGAPVRAGEAICSLCGAPHVPHVAVPGEMSPEWLRDRQEQSRALLAWTSQP